MCLVLNGIRIRKENGRYVAVNDAKRFIPAFSFGLYLNKAQAFCDELNEKEDFRKAIQKRRDAVAQYNENFYITRLW